MVVAFRQHNITSELIGICDIVGVFTKAISGLLPIEGDCKKMMRKICIVIFLISPCLPVSIQAAPAVSKELREAMSRQQQRALNNNKDLTAFKNELKPLADKGDPVAQFFYAVTSGHPFTKSNLKYLHASANEGCAGSAGIIAMYYAEKNSAMGRYWLQYAAKNGDGNSQLTLGLNYFKGLNGFAKMPVKGYAWLLHSRDQIYSRAAQLTVEMMLMQLNPDISNKLKSEGQKYYLKLKKKYPVKPYYLCGQMIPGNDRIPASKLDALKK